MASFKIHGIRSPIRFVNNIYKMLPVKASLCFLKYLDNENNSLIFYLSYDFLLNKIPVSEYNNIITIMI